MAMAASTRAYREAKLVPRLRCWLRLLTPGTMLESFLLLAMVSVGVYIDSKVLMTRT